MSSYVSNTISGSINFSGLGSETDFSAMIAGLKTIEEIPKQRMTLWKGEWEYRMAAMEEVLKVMQEGKAALSDFNSMSKMMDIKVDSSEKEVATATINTGSDLVEGNYSIDVEQLATASLFSAKKKFPAKTSIINSSTTDTQAFDYTYKGITRSIECPPGTSLDQLVLRINNDIDNPGVRASLIKNGDKYMFQIQGKETGIDSQLHVSSTLVGFEGSEHLFTAADAVLSPTGTPFSLFYKGKKITENVVAGETAETWVDRFNTQAGNPVKATLVREGSDYIIQYTDRSSGAKIMPPIDSSLAQLGGQSGVTIDPPLASGGTAAGTIINDTTKNQSYTYSHAGKDYTVLLAPGQTLGQLVAAINTAGGTAPDGTAAGPAGISASISAPDPVTGKVSIEMQSNDVVLNTSTGSQEVKYKINNGTEFTFMVEAGATVKEYAAQFNAASKSHRTGITAKVDNATGQLTYVRDSAPTIPIAPPVIDFTMGTGTGFTLADITPPVTHTLGTIPHEGGGVSNMEGLGKKEIISGKDTVINNNATNEPFAVTLKTGTPPVANTYNYTVPPGQTLDEFITNFNADPAQIAGGVSAVAVPGPSGYTLGFAETTAPATATSTWTPIATENVDTNNPTLPLLEISAEGWNVQVAQDAKFTINGWDDSPMTSSTNKLTEVIDGMTITMKSAGETQFSISSDSSELETSIFTIIDTFNLMKGTILNLQKVDTDKPRSNPDADKMQSQFEWQAGSALTGNYGVQMILSQFSDITSGAAKGFVGMMNTEDTLNDPFTALGQIGISTVTNPSSDSFGLLEIDSEKLSAALKKDPEAVASLFSATLTGTTTSSDFDVASTGMFATAGAYEVTYTVNAAGSPENVTINGAPGLTDPAYPGRFTVGDSNNAALGVAIQFGAGGLNPSVSPPGSPVGTPPIPYTGTIQLKQGKVNEMMAFLDDELKRTSVEGEPQGTLPTIISNYAEIAENIQTKIDKETKRISVWERRQKLKYARLDAVLGQYNAQLESMESMLPSNN